MKEINYKEMRFNPFNLIGGEWMLVTAGDENSCNTMTASWGHLGCLWGPQRDFHTMYVGKIEKVLVRDDEYLK